MRLVVALWLFGITFGVESGVADVITDVSVSPPFFNPSVGQLQKVQFRVARAGTVTVDVLDRDRYVIRSWQTTVTAGPVAATWDGRDDGGAVVPDEAYSLRLTLLGEPGVPAVVYDSAADFDPMPESPKADFFSPESGVLGYTLAQPSRVHVQAGEVRPDPGSGKPMGPVLKTLVDNSPRVSGPVIEKWNGLDEGGTISVSSLPHFVVAVFATPLPPATMIAIGNREQSFFDYALAHRPPQDTRPRDLRTSHLHHHRGLTALEDQTPPLRVETSGAWDEIHRRWNVRAPFTATLTVSGKGAPYFIAQPNVLTIFVDGAKVRDVQQPDSPLTVRFSKSELSPGAHRIAFNWISRVGPTAVGVIAVDVAKSPRARKGDR